jgi:2-polyprenyl-6-methoxyphenol hydroxylase-like FAD-dependent oxidoreductase
MLDSKIPSGPLDNKWTYYKGHCKLVNPANKRKLEIIVVGTGLAGASAAASLGELGYQVKAFCFQDSPRRAHSIAAQGGINAAKTIRTTVTPLSVCFTIPSKAAIIVHESQCSPPGRSKCQHH